ncbi:unnamed protein product [Polarella glacialis]|uniref:Uncharacterized protein n=1 Tax=Polarella glacialis TaxID=89957 RepID=A0A813GKA8_POLGL|nr:unnamed protein product [Polarella glacialis]
MVLAAGLLQDASVAHQLPLLADEGGESRRSEPQAVRWRRVWVAHTAGSAVTVVAICVMAVMSFAPRLPSDVKLQPTSEMSSSMQPLPKELVLLLAEPTFTIPATCLTAMLIAALASCVCCCGCSPGAEAFNPGCCRGCCRQFCSAIVGMIGLSKNGVPIWSLASMWQATMGQSGGYAALTKGILLSGFGFLGGVVLSGSAAVAALAFCRQYNEACGGCVGSLPDSLPGN